MNNNPATQLINPFVGLRAFEETEDYLFFGRGKEIDELLTKFNNNSFLAVIGSSGSGKSSLVKSGMLPAIYSGFMNVGNNWRVALMQPGENPIGYLTKQLAAEGVLYRNTEKAAIPYESIIESRLRRSENGLVHVYTDARLPGKENLLIVVDQFEELFRFSKYEKDNKLGKSDAMHFIQILLTAAQQEEYPIYVLLTMRSDFLGDCAEFRGLPEAINNGQYLVPRMIRDEIREAITGPVAVSGATITDRLVTRLLNDINNDTDQLPVLQHAMMRTWDAWYKKNQLDTPIDFEDYEKIGTMKAALSIHADEAYTDVDTKAQEVCEVMFKALTDKAADPRGTRRPRSVADLCVLTGAQLPEINNIVEIFRKPGRTFLMPPWGIQLKDDSIIDISHESLMRVWERLSKWADDESRSSDVYLRLAGSAQLKEENQRGLLKDPELKLALNWKEKNKPSEKWAEGFKTDFGKTMAYLDESRVKDIADKEVLAKVAEEKIAEEKKAVKRKFKNWIFLLMAFLLIGSSFSIYRLIISKQDLAHQTLVAKSEKKNAQDSAMSALAQRAIAQEQRRIAQDSTNSAIRQREIADSLANLAYNLMDTANRLRGIAEKNAHDANDSAASAKKQRNFANDQKEIAYDNSLKNAASVYARLIREGPTRKKDIQDSAFDYKLVAYTEHLDVLKNLITTRINKELPEYQDLLEKLYYNNDLYEKIYNCLSLTNPKAKKMLFDSIAHRGNFSGDNDKKNHNFYNIDSVLKKSGKKIIKIIENANDKRIFCSTNDNYIYVYKPGSTIPENKIAMGAKVTAIDYNSENDIIYFGLEGGDIGYIKYMEDIKNQPVFENALYTPITAIQFFKFRTEAGTDAGTETSFLLVAGKQSKVVVYELDKKNPVPDKKLLGNILPERNLIDVTNAKYENKKITIEVKFSRPGTLPLYYSWNPFTAEALAEYKKYKKKEDYTERYFNPTKKY